MLSISISRLDPEVPMPRYALAGDAGFDMYAREELVLLPGERGQAKTGIALAIPPGYVGLIWDKSGVSHKGGIKTLGGVVDSGYRGEVMVGLINLGKEAYTFKKGDKVAQMLIQKVEQAEFVEVNVLPESERGSAGFGSTGK